MGDARKFREVSLAPMAYNPAEKSVDPNNGKLVWLLTSAKIWVE